MDTDLAWAAGFIDGEGTITLKRYKSHYTTHKIHYQPFVSLGQANYDGHFAGVERMKEIFGGSVSKYKAVPPRQEQLTWCVVSRQAVDCLKRIRPYLIVKAKHADLLISYYETAGLRESYRITDEELAKREKIWSKMRSMNQKGKLHLQRLSEITPKGDATV
jgi:hypothetical protein